MAENYQLLLDKTLHTLQAAGETPRLLLHSCCAPCSSYVLEYLSRYFFITVLYYNPNISPETEFQHRLEEQQRLIGAMPFSHPVELRAGIYAPERFDAIARGHEADPEGGDRCHACYRLRLEETAMPGPNGWEVRETFQFEPSSHAAQCARGSTATWRS